MKEAKILVTGLEFNKALNKNFQIFKRASVPPDSKKYIIKDISEDQDGSIVTWYDRKNKTQFIYSKYNIVMNSNSASMFITCHEARNIDISYMDPSEVESMILCFSCCSQITNSTTKPNRIINSVCKNCILLPDKPFSKLNNMSFMYVGCKRIKWIDFSKFPINACEAICVFEGCDDLSSVRYPSNITKEMKDKMINSYDTRFTGNPSNNTKK